MRRYSIPYSAAASSSLSRAPPTTDRNSNTTLQTKIPLLPSSPYLHSQQPTSKLQQSFLPTAPLPGFKFHPDASHGAVWKTLPRLCIPHCIPASPAAFQHPRQFSLVPLWGMLRHHQLPVSPSSSLDLYTPPTCCSIMLVNSSILDHTNMLLSSRLLWQQPKSHL